MMDDLGAAAQAQRVGHHLMDSVEEFVRHNGVRIDKDENLPMRGSSTSVPNAGDITNRLTDYPCPGYPCSLSRPIGACVVHDDEFDAALAIRSSPLETRQRSR